MADARWPILLRTGWHLQSHPRYESSSLSLLQHPCLSEFSLKFTGHAYELLNDALAPNSHTHRFRAMTRWAASSERATTINSSAIALLV